MEVNRCKGNGEKDKSDRKKSWRSRCVCRYPHPSMSSFGCEGGPCLIDKTSASSLAHRNVHWRQCRSAQDHVRSLLGDHDHRRIRVATYDAWHDRRVHNAKTFEPVDTSLQIHHRVVVHAHASSTRRVVLGPGMLTKPGVDRLVRAAQLDERDDGVQPVRELVRLRAHGVGERAQRGELTRQALDLGPVPQRRHRPEARGAPGAAGRQRGPLGDHEDASRRQVHDLVRGGAFGEKSSDRRGQAEAADLDGAGGGIQVEVQQLGRLVVVQHEPPVPVDERLEMRARLDGRERRKLFISAEARAGEEIVATCKAIYITVDPSRFAQLPDPR